MRTLFFFSYSYFGLTCTFGPGPQRRPGGSCSSLQRSGQQNADLVLGVGVQVADLVRGLVHGLQVVHGARHGAVFHLPVDDGAVPVDAVGVELDPEVGGADGC